MNIHISEQECLDVAHLMQLTAERDDTPVQCKALMRRGASLLIQLAGFCTILGARKEKESISSCKTT